MVRWPRTDTTRLATQEAATRVQQPVQQSPPRSNQIFRYTELQYADSIRLLKIAARADSPADSRLKASIYHARLTRSPLYTAVSWLWGPPKELVEIEIDGKTFKIQKNLERIIRLLQDDRQTRDLWIDAICINQESISERNHQVRLMGQIYNRANYIVACLMAERPRDRKKLRKTAKKMHQLFGRPPRQGTAIRVPFFTQLSKGYSLFFDNSYFTRRWVIQEIIQARSVILCCEGYQIHLGLLESIANGDRVRQHNRINDVDRNGFMESRAMSLCRLRREMNGNQLPLEELLYTHEKAECSELRDRIYAVLPMSQQAKNHLHVEYNTDPTELMLSVVTVCSMHEGLSPSRTLSFACFLRQHLEVSAADVQTAIRLPPLSAMNAAVSLQGVVHNIVDTYRPSAEAEALLMKARKRVPSLKVLDEIKLTYSDPANLEWHPDSPMDIPRPADQNAPNSSATVAATNQPVSVPGLDQHALAFEVNVGGNQPRAGHEAPTIVGLASVKVEQGDEIWQFQRTPLAFIARPFMNGYTLVGRACLFTDLTEGPDTDRQILREDELVWIKDASTHARKIPSINVNVVGLLNLMLWCTYDT